MDSRYHEEAVSSVVGEMVLLALAIILVALFAASAFSLLPGGRDDVVDVVMTNTTDTVTFWHKGGDWVEKDDLEVVIIGRDRSKETISSFTLDPDTRVFDLGSSLTVETSLKKGDVVRLVTGHNVVFAGVI